MPIEIPELIITVEVDDEPITLGIGDAMALPQHDTDVAYGQDRTVLEVLRLLLAEDPDQDAARASIRGVPPSLLPRGREKLPVVARCSGVSDRIRPRPRTSLRPTRTTHHQCIPCPNATQ